LDDLLDLGPHGFNCSTVARAFEFGGPRHSKKKSHTAGRERRVSRRDGQD
jgi:hypothetical protein